MEAYSKEAGEIAKRLSFSDENHRKLAENIAMYVLAGESEQNALRKCGITEAQYISLCLEAPSFIQAMSNSENAREFAAASLSATAFQAAKGGISVKKEVIAYKTVYEDGKAVSREPIKIEVSEQTKPNEKILLALLAKTTNFSKDAPNSFARKAIDKCVHELSESAKAGLVKEIEAREKKNA